MFEGAENKYNCGGGSGFLIENNGVLTTAYGLTKYPIGTEYPRANTSTSPCAVIPGSSYASYFVVGSTYVAGACIPKNAINAALVCHINYAKNYFKKKCGSKAPTLTKQQMTALIDYYNTGFVYTRTAIETYCNTINSGGTSQQATDNMFKSIFKKENGNVNYNSNCQIIKRRECEAILYFEGNYTCYGQSAYGGNFTYRYEKYHDTAYNCSN